MNTVNYKARLVELEKDLTARTGRDLGRARDQAGDATADAGESSVADETASESFAEAELDSARLGQVRDALRRIDAGTFGACVVDGEPIEAKRLEAIPWTQYCVKHQEQLEAASPSKTPSL